MLLLQALLHVLKQWVIDLEEALLRLIVIWSHYTVSFRLPIVVVLIVVVVSELYA